MTDKKQPETGKDAVELSEDALNQASGGAVFIKFDGVDGEVVNSKISSSIKTGQVFKF